MAQVKEELLNAVKEAQAAMQSIQMELGAIALAELRKEALMAAYKEQQENIQKTTEAIREEYGDGSVNLETGEFTAEAVAEA
jgi:FMN-dependent NADH-azoreductase